MRLANSLSASLAKTTPWPIKQNGTRNVGIIDGTVVIAAEPGPRLHGLAAAVSGASEPNLHQKYRASRTLVEGEKGWLEATSVRVVSGIRCQSRKVLFSSLYPLRVEKKARFRDLKSSSRATFFRLLIHRKSL